MSQPARKLVFVLLEDSPLDADLIASHLARGGYDAELRRVETREGFICALAPVPDLILSDYSLPDFNGLAALEIVRATCPDVPFIFVSGVLGEDVAVETLKRGATDYVLKQGLHRLVPSIARALAEAHERAERRRVTGVLRTSEERLRVALEHAPITVSNCDRDLRYTWVFNPPAWASADAMLGKRDDELAPAEAVAPLLELKREVLHTGTGARREITLTTPGGTLVYDITVEPLRDEANAVVGLTIAAIDVTERKRLQQELSDRNRQLTDADRRKDEFLATLAHELRNPLAPVANAVQVMRLQGIDDPNLRWARDVIGRQVHHLTRLVDDLLDVSRITRGKIQLRRERVELAAIVARAVETSHPLIDAAGHELTVSLPETPVWLDADATRLAQVLANLLNNAAKYTERGGRISLSASVEPTGLVIRVRDTGVGIARDMLPKIFDLFTQADRSLDRSQGGLGIGLSLVQALVQMHGGSVSVYSDGPATGTEFTIRLPVADPAGPQTDGVPAKRVLIVDGDRDNADTLSVLLRLRGYQPLHADNVQEAANLADRERPAIVLIDFGRPGLDGHEVARRLRQKPELAGVLMIALSAHDDHHVSQDAGFNVHLVKPVAWEALDKLLSEAGRSV